MNPWAEAGAVAAPEDCSGCGSAARRENKDNQHLQPRGDDDNQTPSRFDELATVPGKGYFAILRLFGPKEAAINNSWKPGDIENVK